MALLLEGRERVPLVITVRKAGFSDLPWLTEQLRQFADFYGTEHSLFPRDIRVADRIVLEMLRPDDGCFFVAERPRCGHERLGFIAGTLRQHPYNPEVLVLFERFWWVAPEHRGSTAGARLLAAFEAFGAEHADMLTMTLEAKSPIDPNSLKRRGYRLQESSYLKEIVHAQPQADGHSGGPGIPCE